MRKIKIEDRSVNIVTYHYVRNLQNSLYPNLKGLEFSDFKKQINYLSNKYSIISNLDFIEILNSKKFPKKSCFLLTFDDGYVDHYKFVLPYLLKKKISGNFYLPTKVLKKNIMLDVNKIHFILEKESNREKILNLINVLLKKKFQKSLKNLNLSRVYDRRLIDDKITFRIKVLLQYLLPKTYKNYILDKLFNIITKKTVKEFSEKLYLNVKQVKQMYNEGMHIGSHGNNHLWFKYISNKDQNQDIKNSLEFLKKINVIDKNISFSYPYGSYNNYTKKLMKKYNISYALTTKIGNINSKNIDQKFSLRRYDTIDFL